ncbi:MAG: ribonuclease P protein component [Veillonella sp.]|uniref:ribonuclease P protein component n=1 Tax=Veillonella sp. TaxID=1926307 RepID=UPI0025F90A1F|nr:ribonuclease P protein component [Veillonella sp.]MBS4913187.1 ribonuclease P protein component [Veillonella sp.]
MNEVTYGLDKARRIRKNNEYRLVYRHGTYEVGRLCVVYRMPVAKQSTRIGFVTGKKVGGAVERNRARRLMKEVYRLNQHKLKEGYAIVVVGRAKLSKATYEEACKELMYLFRKCKLLKSTKA